MKSLYILYIELSGIEDDAFFCIIMHYGTI